MRLDEFLMARIADDETLANDAASRLGRYGRPDDERWSVYDEDERCSHDTGIGLWVVHDKGGPASGRSEVLGNIDSPFTARHIARWDPARVLAECAAKRRLVELHHPIEVYERWNPNGHCAECSDSGWEAAIDGASPVDFPCPTMRLLALPYADHPDYREEWKP